MKTSTIAAVLIMLSTTLHGAEPEPALEVHEWGTFTTVHASDGTLMTGLEIEEEIIPPFVYSHAGMEPDRITEPGYRNTRRAIRKGFYRPLHNVTVKMETPVLYFYTEQAMSASVEVGFKGGSISQWYPQRSGGETVPPAPGQIDFAEPFNGSIKWDFDILAPGADEAYTPQPSWQPTHWPIARVPAANKIKSGKGEVEHFLFYRGIGNFDLPLHITADAASTLQLTNRGKAPIPYVMVYGRLHYGISRVWWQGPLPAGESLAVPQPGAMEPGQSLSDIFDQFRTKLVETGLNQAEASAMLNTWENSYFEREGLRVFWIAPRSYTDEILPITITPAPDRLERVIVGRSEVLLPEFETFLAQAFRHNKLAVFAGDRYQKAYAQRARQLTAALPHPADAPVQLTRGN